MTATPQPMWHGPGGQGPQQPPRPPRQPGNGRLRAVLPWIVGIVLVVVLILVFAHAIPAAQRPTLGPPSTPATTAPHKSPTSTERGS